MRSQMKYGDVFGAYRLGDENSLNQWVKSGQNKEALVERVQLLI